MSTTIHCALSVRGALRWDRRTMRRHAAGFGYELEVFRDHLLDALSQGKEVLPLGKCDNFDFKRGCLGHEPSLWAWLSDPGRAPPSVRQLPEVSP